MGVPALVPKARRLARVRTLSARLVRSQRAGGFQRALERNVVVEIVGRLAPAAARRTAATATAARTTLTAATATSTATTPTTHAATAAAAEVGIPAAFA